MTQRKRLSVSRQLEKDTAIDTMNREWLPVLRQLTAAPIISGSRSGAPVTILADVLQALQNAGIITDRTTP